MPTVTKFIIALDPARNQYALSFAARAVPTPERRDALRFDTYEAAADVCRDITGWGGAQRVEEIAVEVNMPSLRDPATRIEARDIATSVFVEESNRLQDNDAGISAAAEALRAEGYRVGVDIRNGASSFATINLCDPFGVCLTLDWEPCAEGFDYPTSGDDALEIEDRLDAFEDENPDDDGDDAPALDGAEDDGPADSVSDADLAAFVEGYLDGMFWTSMPSVEDDDDRSLQVLGYGIDQLAPACRSAHEGHCRDFIVANGAALDEAILAYGATTTPSQVGYREAYTLRMAGLDFWLSRNGHGAGFFDRGRDGCWTRLQRAAKVYGSCEIVSVETAEDGKTIVTVEA